MSNKYKTTCHVCWGENINLNEKGRLVRHFERVVTGDGKVTVGGFRCAGSGEEPEPVEVADVVS
jgi:hypothetical protein